MIEIKMPALSPTMEEGTLTKWLVKKGDTVSSGDILAEIETDKATMEFEAVDEGTIVSIAVPEGSEGVKVGTVIAVLAGEGEDASVALAGTDFKPARSERVEGPPSSSAAPAAEAKSSASTSSARAEPGKQDRVIASPLAKRIADQKGLDLKAIKGSGPGGRIVKADVDGAQPGATVPAPTATPAPAPAAVPVASSFTTDIPHEAVKLTMMRKTIARRLTESKQTVPHIYLTVDVQLDALLKLRGELNATLDKQGVKLSVNDLLIKALAKALKAVPACNVTYTPEALIQYQREDISVAVSTPTGLITPIIADAANKALSAVSIEMKALADKAKAGKLQPHEFQGGTASLSNMGMFGIKQFEAVINPPQGMIMAIGAGEQRPYVVDGALAVATVMSATGSFDHRAIDGADGAQLMQVFKDLCENPLGLVA